MSFKACLKFLPLCGRKNRVVYFRGATGKFNFQNHAVHLLVGQGFREHCYVLREPSREKAKRYRDGVIANADS